MFEVIQASRRPDVFEPASRSDLFLGTYHVNDGTDNLVNLSHLRRLGGHVTCSEGRKDGLGGLEGGGIGEPGRPQRGADSPSRSKSSNPAKRWGKKQYQQLTVDGWLIDGAWVLSYLLNMMGWWGTGWNERRGVFGGRSGGTKGKEGDGNAVPESPHNRIVARLYVAELARPPKIHSSGEVNYYGTIRGGRRALYSYILNHSLCQPARISLRFFYRFDFVLWS